MKRLLKYLLMLAVVVTAFLLTTPAASAIGESDAPIRYCDSCDEKVPFCSDCGDVCLACSPGCIDDNCYLCESCWVPCEYCENVCALCYYGCTECNACEECVLWCTECTDASGCMLCNGGCLECETCADCTPLCEECGDRCVLEFPGCLDCIICEECYEEAYCSVCQACMRCHESGCSDCTDICEDCADEENVCADCGRCLFCIGELTCEECNLCEECMEEDGCSGCGECTRCADLRCEGCGSCEDCGYICLSCEEACSECAEICSECEEVCEDCADSWCEDCGICGDCVDMCEDCGEICIDCADAWCENCNLCSDCVDLCEDCEEICEDCADDWCEECSRCIDCFDVWCEECQTCGDCVELCADCEEICVDCAKGWCAKCDSCNYCAELCPDCGEICEDCADLICVDCGACDDCVKLCGECEEICEDCAGGWCPECEKCDICVEPCMVCQKTCTDCCDCEEEQNQEHKHSLSRVKPVDPTCTEPGNILYYVCDECDKWYEDSSAQNEITDKNSVILTTSHNLGALIPEVDPVHTVNKLKEGMRAHYICGNCKVYFNAQKRQTTKEDLVIPAPEHTYIANVYKGKDGHAAVCACGAKEAVQPHVPGPTATETTDQTCAVCGYIIQVSLNHQHDPEKVPAKDPTCTESGNKEHYVCDCGKIFQDAAGNKEITIVGAITIPPTHSYGDLIEQVPPSHGKDGATDGMLSHYHCPDCGQDFTPEKVPVSKETLTVSASDHEFTDADGDGICDGCKKAENSALEKIESNADPIKPDDPNQGSTSDSGKAEINNTSNGDDKSGIPWWLVLLLALLMTGCGVMIAVFVSKKKAEKE